jgi:type I restriction-modification system DNA methylase subunit
MPLFQNSVLNKYLKAQDKTVVAARWVEFKSYFLNPAIQNNIRQLKEEEFQEGFVRELFVKIFGYTLNPQPDYNFVLEKKNVKDSKKADGAIIIDTKVTAVVELKGTDTIDLGKIETQAFGYKNNQVNCNYVITSNFEKLRFYIDNAVEHLEFNLFSLTEKDFELLHLCLAYENLSKGLAKKVKDESASHEAIITKQLYKDYSLFKNSLYQNLVAQNPQYDALQLFKKSQKLLDRFLFIFFAEDRNLLPTNLIFRINKEWRQLREMRIEVSLYERYKIYFDDLNTGAKVKLPAFNETSATQTEEHQIFAYNGGLFKKDDVLDNITIDDELLYLHTQKISTYDFDSEIDVNILGHIFENSLNEIDEVKASLEGVAIDKTKTRRKKDGVFYTPKYITKYIVDNTVGKLCNEKKVALDITDDNYQPAKQRSRKRLDSLQQYRNWLLQLTICDPACGSGAFLNQALEFLIEEHRYIDQLSATYNKDTVVLYDVENSILENNLFGVDLNDESVEIAKLSLWLRTAQPHRKLNDLSNNIKTGNSLIDDPTVAGDKAFNWQEEFPQIFGKGGFDVVIGNPPYVDIKGLNKIDVNYFFKAFTTSENRINLYSIFIEKGLSLINQNGILSYINPNSMLVNSSYSKLRNLILPFLNKVVKLPDDIFQDAKVETIIFELLKNQKSDYIKIINYNKSEKISEIDNSKMKSVNAKDWQKEGNFNLYISSNERQIIKKIESKDTLSLHEVANFSLGITPYDKYKGHTEDIIRNRIYHSVHKINDAHKPLIAGENIKRYITDNNSNEYINYGDWLGAKRDEKFFTEPRILIRQIVSGVPLRIYAGYSEEPLYFTQIGFGVISKNDLKFNNKFLLTLLNSTLINYYHKYKFLDLEKQLFQKVLIANAKIFPIKKLSVLNQQPFIKKADIMLSSNKALQELSQKFQRTVQRKFEIQDLPKKLQDWYLLSYGDFIKELGKKKVRLSLSQEAEWEDYFTQEKQKATALKTTIDATDKEIDQMVYALYGLTPEEIEIVEKG